MKLDPTVMRTMNRQDFRVLEAVETGMKDHASVPLPLITSIANLRHGGAHKILSGLLRDKLLSHEVNKACSHDGYRLTNAGYDILALHNLKSRGIVAALGQRIGTGKESDIYLAVRPSGQQVVLKFHRLGRTSFRNVRKKRDYFKSSAAQQAHSWLFLSRLSALKEYAFMKALYEVDYPTPTPLAHNRHVVAMSLVRGLPLFQIHHQQLSVEQAADIYEQSLSMARRLARQHGLVHCDLNEFNLLVDLSGVQSLAATDESGDGDTYVRHSGRSTVAPEQSRGSLSKPLWEQALEDDDGEPEAPLEPAARLETGEPKPIVTLIDFPQMISTQHPNAKEYYLRDLACLRRFFEKKLQCSIPEDDADDDTTWESTIASQGEHVDETADQRLDRELRASGYSDKWKLGLELYYFDEEPTVDVAVAIDGEGEDDTSEEEHYNESVERQEKEGEQEQSDSLVDQPSHPDVGVTDIDHSRIDLDDDVDDDDNVPEVEVTDLLDEEALQSITQDRIQEQVKHRVRRQIEEQRRRSRQRGAFRKKKNNKTYDVKGKRIFADAGL